MGYYFSTWKIFWVTGTGNMRWSKKQLFITAGIVAFAIVASLAFRYFVSPSAKAKRSPVQSVKTANSEKRTLPVTLQANGYVTALQTVEVRPQLQNIVRSIHVKEGQFVEKGQLLFTLDERSDAAGVDKARAQLARDNAELADAESTLQRNQDLLRKGFVSQAVVDSARNKVNALRGSVRADQAGIQSSNVALGFNKITAGIGGRIGAIAVHPGSLAQPSGAPMLTISQLDPIAVSFTVPESTLAHIRATYPQGGAPVSAQLPGGDRRDGLLYFIDNATDQQSGTIRMKAQFDNRDHRLWPGSFINVSLITRILPDAVTVPAQAVVTGPKDQFVYVVQPGDTVAPQKISVLAIESGTAAVSGLAEGARVVIEGASNLRPGSKVKEAAEAPASPTSSS